MENLRKNAHSPADLGGLRLNSDQDERRPDVAVLHATGPARGQGRRTVRRLPLLRFQADSAPARGTSSRSIGRSAVAAMAMNWGIALMISARGMVPGPLPRISSPELRSTSAGREMV